MKTSGHLILYISESEDFELWRVLSQISPDDRAAFVKSALRKALSQGNEARNAGNSWAKQSNVLRMDKSAVENPITDLVLEELGYNTLAAAEEKIKPLKYLANEVKNNSREANSGAGRKNNLQEEDNLNLINLNDLELFPDSEKSGPLHGLDFLLSNVIGEEDDEKVIEFIRKSKSQ